MGLWEGIWDPNHSRWFIRDFKVSSDETKAQEIVKAIETDNLENSQRQAWWRTRKWSKEQMIFQRWFNYSSQVSSLPFYKQHLMHYSVVFQNYSLVACIKLISGKVHKMDPHIWRRKDTENREDAFLIRWLGKTWFLQRILNVQKM